MFTSFFKVIARRKASKKHEWIDSQNFGLSFWCFNNTYKLKWFFLNYLESITLQKLNIYYESRKPKSFYNFDFYQKNLKYYGKNILFSKKNKVRNNYFFQIFTNRLHFWFPLDIERYSESCSLHFFLNRKD